MTNSTTKRLPQYDNPVWNKVLATYVATLFGEEWATPPSNPDVVAANKHLRLWCYEDGMKNLNIQICKLDGTTMDGKGELAGRILVNELGVAIVEEHYMPSGKLNNTTSGKPARMERYEDGAIKYVAWMVNGCPIDPSPGYPWRINYAPDGTITGGMADNEGDVLGATEIIARIAKAREKEVKDLCGKTVDILAKTGGGRTYEIR